MAKINRATMALITLSTALPCFAQSYDDDGAQSFNLILTLFLFLATAIVSFQDNKGIKTSSPGTGKWLWSLIIIPTFFAFLAFAIVINTLFNSDILKIFDTMSIVLAISCVATLITWIILRLAILKRKRTYTEHKHKIFIVFWSCCLIYEIIGCILSSKVYDFAGWEYYEYIAKLLPFNPIEVLGGKLVISWIILMIVSIVFSIIGWRELNASNITFNIELSQNKKSMTFRVILGAFIGWLVFYLFIVMLFGGDAAGSKEAIFLAFAPGVIVGIIVAFITKSKDSETSLTNNATCSKTDSSNTDSKSVSEQLIELKKLADDGILTAEEFNALKAKYLKDGIN